ncbi:MAG: hypothetical protein HY905_04780 [Deltaproteobacteria bacterium]|nr:hypothetical protein [Deltaproteobacteria bacterium]
MTACDSQLGCGWNYHDLDCIATRPGGAVPCEAAVYEDECRRQAGCTWE